MITTITLSQTEAEDLIKNFKEVDVVTITNTTENTGFVEGILRVTRIDFPYTYQTNEKIVAIRRLREYVKGLGLGDAKYAVENPDKAILDYLRTGVIRDACGN